LNGPRRSTERTTPSNSWWAGILQAPFFDLNADMAINCGGIGGVIGHEITHVLTNRGQSIADARALEA
jgi:predicted metalloendopeptidase